MEEKITRVLLVEDSPVITRMVSDMLAESKSRLFHVECVDKLQAGLERLSFGDIDVVILDLMLPDSQGFETFLRVCTKVPNVPIVVSTSMDDETIAVEAVKRGAQDYLVKGQLDTNLLVRSLHYAIERKSAEIALRKANDELEQRVADRTTELRKVNEQLRQEIEEGKKKEEEISNAYSRLKSAQDQLIQAEKMQVVGSLASGVAHEVKNPLAIILQGVGYFSKTLNLDNKDVMLVLKSMHEAVTRADNIIRGLLDFSRVTTLQIATCDLNSVMEKSLLLVKYELVKKQIELIKELQENLPTVSLDENKMEQVLVNLVLNAAQAMSEGGKITIRTYAKVLDKVGNGVGRRQGDIFVLGEKVVVVEVQDTGTGIPQEYLDKIFDPFFTTKRGKGGTGLGLSVVLSIIDMHKGRIRIENRKDSPGAIATIMLKT